VSWKASNAGLEVSAVRALAVSGSGMFAGTEEDGVFLSVDNGATWSELNDGLPYGSWISCFAQRDGELLLGRSNMGVWRLSLSSLSKQRTKTQ
jgi:ligand-binding sensor domain-containing protein